MSKQIYVVILISILILLLSNISLLFGLFQTPSGLVFLGRRDINSQDVYTYLSFIEQSKQGHVLFENLYAVEPQKADIFRPSYLAIGKLAWLLNISSLAAYHIARIAICILFFFVLYKFLSLFFKENRTRLLAYAIVLLSSGVGFLIRFIAPNSTDTWIPEANTFLSLAEAPHFLLSQILMLLGFMAFLKALTLSLLPNPRTRSVLAGSTARTDLYQTTSLRAQRGNLLSLRHSRKSGNPSPMSFWSGNDHDRISSPVFNRYYLLSALCFLFLSFEHPFNIAVTGATVVLTTFWLIKTKPVILEGAQRPIGELVSRKLEIGSPVFNKILSLRSRMTNFKSIYPGVLLIILVSALGLGYQIYETYQNPILNSWASQNALLSPNTISYLSGYGFLIVLAAIGMEKFLKEKKPPQVLIIAWIASTAVLLYTPIFFQRRFSEGLHIPLAVLATWGVLKLTGFISRFSIERAQKYVVNFFWVTAVIILSLTSFVRVLTDVSIFAGENKGGYYYYILTSEMKGLNWLKTQTLPNDIVMTNWFYGNILPGIIGRKVYLGHKVQTPFFDKKVESENKFFLNKNTTEAYKFLKENRVTYIFLGTNDTILQYGFKPDEKPYLTKVWDEGGVLIYKVK